MRTAGRSSHADGKALLRSCCLVVELDVEAAPEYPLRPACIGMADAV